MSQFFIAIILVLGAASFWMYQQNQVLEANNLVLKGNVIQLEGAVEQQKAAMEAMKESFERQGKALNNMQQANAAIEAEKDRYLDIFRRHNLDKLALAKPGLIENRINSGTAKVFEDLENDSKNISAINNNQPN